MSKNWRKKFIEKIDSSPDYTGYRAKANTNSSTSKSSSSSADWRQKMKDAVDDGSAAKKYQERYGTKTTNSSKEKQFGNTLTNAGVNGALTGGVLASNNPTATAKKVVSGKRTTADGATRVDQVMAAAINSTLSAFQKLAADVTSPTGNLSMGESAQAAINEAKTAKKEGRQAKLGQAQRNAEQEKKKRIESGAIGDLKQAFISGAQKSAESAYESERHAKEGLGKFGQGVVDFGIAGAQFAGDALLNAVAPGTGLAAMAGRAYGSASLDAQQRGLSEGEQQISGLKSAAIEMLTEKLFGSVSKVAYGKGIIRNESLVNSLVNRLAKTDRGRTALKVLVGANEEGLEEVLSDILNPIADRILKLDDGKGDWSDLADDFDTQQMLEDYIIGGALGLAGAGTNVVSGQYRAENAQQRAYEEYQRQLVNAGLATEQGGDAQLTAEKYKNILDQSTQRGKRNLSDKETENLERLMTIGTDTQTMRDMLAQSGVLVDDNTAQAAALAASGQKLSNTQNAAIGNAAVQDAINQMAGNGVVDNIRRTAANEYNKPIVINNMARQYEVAPEVVERTYNLNPTAPQAFETAFNAVYQMGQQGTDKAALGKVPVLSTAQANIAYQMGADSVNAANVSTEAPTQAATVQAAAPVTINNTQEVNDNGVRIHNVAERINGQNTEGQIRGVETGAGENVTGGSQKEQGGISAAQIKTGEKVSYKGKQQKGVYYAAEDTEDMKKGRKLAESYGYKVRYFVGGNIHYAGGEFRGVVDTANKTVMVRADHPDYTAEQIMRHEMGHAAFENGDLSLNEAKEMLLGDFTEDELNELIEIYSSEYGGILSTDEAFEEICCDALGRMNIFEGTDLNSESYGKAQDTVRKYAAEKTGSKGRAPPKKGGVKYSRQAEDKYFARQIDQWDGKDHGGAFRVGGVSEPLLKVGIPNTDIWFDQSKAAKQLLEKGEITKAVIKQIPEILQHPIAISESYDSTVMVFGQVFDANGNPIVVALRVNSTKRRNSITLVNKIRSVGSRSHNLDKLLNDSNILYLGENKKETKAWFNALGRSTPFGGTKFGLIRSVSFADAAVKKYSLEPVKPIQPKSGEWERGSTTDEVRAKHPDLWAVDAESSESRNPTQISGTVKSYRKIYDALKAEGFDGTVLDASSGLGYGTRAGIEEYWFNVEDIEPFPDSSYKPKYTDYSKLHKKYDVIISNAVLNVLPQDQRDALVVKMGQMLNDGGRMFINVRGTDVRNASSKVPIDEANMEYYISNTGSYQKGFTKKELVSYLSDALGEDYTVVGTNKFGAVSAVVTKQAEVSKKFSMEAPIERKKNLIALHNLNETKLLKTLKLGGFPMPSIAITKSDIPHTNFGNITIVFGKETIDPKFDKRNTVYSADAWTPLFPRIEYEANEKAASKIRNRYYALSNKFGYELTKPLYASANYVDDVLTKYGGEEGVVEHFADDTEMMNVFLADTGKEPVKPVQSETITRLSNEQIKEYDTLIKVLGKDTLNEMTAKANQSPLSARKQWLEKHGEELKNAFAQYLIETGMDETTVKEVTAEMSPSALLTEAVSARKYLKNGAETRTVSTDIKATKEAIRSAVDAKEYKAWLKNLYSGIVKDSGVYNNKDYYTSSGNRRSFKATHFPGTLEGIVKAMASQGEGDSRNVMGFHGVKSLRAGTAERFKSIEDMHKLEGRLKHLTPEEANEISEALDGRLSELMHSIYELIPHSSYSNKLIELDAMGEIFMEAARLKYISPANVKALFKKYNYPLTDKMANDVVALLFDINNMPVNIFEAKPERAVGFDEIRKVIIPDTSSDELRTALRDAGIENVEEYTDGDDATRMRIANEVPDVHFSREPERLNELRRQNERKLAQATAEDAANENERGLIRDYQKQYSKVEDIREKLSTAQQMLTEAEDGGTDYDTTIKAKNRFTVLSNQYAREHRKLENYANMKALQNVLTRVDERLGNDLPEGMGAASANFTGEETVGERWVTEAQGEGDSALHPISKEQEANLAEQQHRAPQEIPKKDLNGKLTSKHVSTIVNSGMTPAEFSEAMLDDAALGKFSHIAYSDEEALKKAERAIEDDGWDQALANYKAEINSGRVSKDNTVMGIALYNNAVNSGDYATAMDIASLMVKNSTNTAQSLQAMRILNKLSPECRLYLAAKSIENIEEDLNERYKDNKADIHVDKILYDEYAKALRQGDEDGIKTAWANIEQSVAQQIDATWYEKLNNFRYLAMLGNPRTHVRNIVGNAFFVPVRAVKNTIAYGLENIADAKINGGIERSKAILNPNNAADAALVKYAMSDYEAVQEVILSGGKYVDTFQGIDKHRTIYKTKILEAARKGNSAALDAEDAWFCKPAYANALAKWYKANGISADQLNTGKVPEETIIKAQTTAIKEAQKATYRDTNWFSAQVSRLGKVDNKVAAVLIEGVLPFKKTPANILARAVEYSPVGLVKSLALDTKKVKAYVNGDVENGMSPAQFIDDISAGLTGTALMGLGILLASWGVLSGGDDDDEKQNYFDDLSGKQNYALSIGGLSITLDWLAPESMPLFVGVELFNSLSSKNEDKGFLQNLMSSVMSLSTPMFEMSMLQSVNDLFDNLAYIKQGQGTFKIVSSMAANYISQYFPTLFGQAERSFEEAQRETTYIDRNSKVGTELQYMWGKIANKIPFYDFSQIPYIDAWGRTEETGNLFERMLNNFINPAYVKKERPTEIDGELERLYDLGETSVYPGRAKTNTKINGEYLTADEYVKYATTKGQTSYELAQGVINSAAYSGASDPEKAYMLKYVYSYADHIAKYEVNNDYSLAKWEVAAYKSANPMQAIIDHAREYYNPDKEN